ncbi:hypothetical protein OBBRIDRAFT_789334 [Obba rivulosa]|uniref:Uncharacterized protein n=1 Tax=Obba rivulosa TaxID=1052685 RepID=A0A8E2J4G4_9APHY|nr:hypothetical protein OBBRIDRAFT_789334 [Obba rivulosa]
MSRVGSGIRGPTPLRITPSSAPLESMITSQQSQIDDLVAKSRTLEHTIEKLRAAVSDEQTRSKQAVADEQARSKQAIEHLQKRWQDERTEWRDGCEMLQAAHRIAHLRTADALDSERLTVLKEREALRTERLARLQRDFRLVTFQRRETELEERVGDLEWELEEVRRTTEEEQSVLNEELQDKVGALEGKRKKLAAELSAALKAKTEAEDALSRLRAEHTALVATSTSTSTKLERTMLHLDGLKDTHAALEAKHAETERINADLRRQVEKWRNLESREGAEMDTLRRSRIELEVKVKEFEVRLKEAEERADKAEAEAEENGANFTKAKGKLEKYRISIQEHIDALSESQAAEERLEVQLEETHQKLRVMETQIQQLKSQLPTGDATIDVARANGEASAVVTTKRSKAKPSGEAVSGRARSSSEGKLEIVVIPRPSVSAANGRPNPAPAGSDSDDVQEVTETKSKPKPRPTGKAKKNVDEGDGHREPASGSRGSKKQTAAATDAEADGDGKKRRGRPKKAKPVESDSEVQIVERSPKDKKGKRKADVLDDEVEEVRAPTKRSKKAAAADDEEQERPYAKARGKAREGSAVPSKGPKGKPASRASRQAEQSADEASADGGGGDAPQKKKKRKINLFPTHQAASFTWDQMGGGDGGLNIPMDLSPVKESGPVPPRATSALGRVGSMLGGFSSRR